MSIVDLGTVNGLSFVLTYKDRNRYLDFTESEFAFYHFRLISSALQKRDVLTWYVVISVFLLIIHKYSICHAFLNSAHSRLFCHVYDSEDPGILTTLVM